MSDSTPAASPTATVVVGYLDTPAGNAALDAATAQAERMSARLVVVNTGRNGDYSHPNFAAPQDLDAIDERLTRRGVAHEIVQPTDGRPAAQVILEAAAGADLLVIGLRRRTAVGKLLLGSTAQELLLSADCPVLAVKPD